MAMSPMRDSRDAGISWPAIPIVGSGPNHDWNRRPRKCPSAQRRVRYDDDEDDFDINVGRPPRSYENPTSAGMIGFIAAMVSLGFLAVVVVLYIFLQEENRRAADIERTRLLYIWFLILDVLSFFAALTATILGARGSSPTNPIYRGYGIAALIMGIFEMVITVIFGLFMTCCALLPLVLMPGFG
jgi:hypothetical protein